MRYIDSGRRDPKEALGTWLQGVQVGELAEIRWQTGFFGADALGILLPILEGARKQDCLIRVLVGSNDCSTSVGDLNRLATAIGIPSPNASLGVVAFSGAFFHPKVVHFSRTDGTQFAYVGSANLTRSGISGIHVEAGVLLDERDGDNGEELDRVRLAIDRWFDEQPPGIWRVERASDIDELLQDGILKPDLPEGPARTAPKSTRSGNLPTLKPLLDLPKPPDTERDYNYTSFSQAEPTIPVAPRSGFPGYMLFDPAASAPTKGARALTGTTLPGGVVGLVTRLNRDSGRHFIGAPGTANQSIPVATVHTIRFGLFGVHGRPRAEFDLMIRYVGSQGEAMRAPGQTSIMGYGYTPTESGSRDIRMVIPATVRTVREALALQGDPIPEEGDFAFLEWPTTRVPEFRLTYLDRTSPLAAEAATLFQDAAEAGNSVGDGACWLPKGLSPSW